MVTNIFVLMVLRVPPNNGWWLTPTLTATTMIMTPSTTTNKSTTKINTSSQTAVHSLSHPWTQITAFLCNSKDKHIFDPSLSPDGTIIRITFPGTSKLEGNIKITNLGGLLVHDFVGGRYNQVLALKIKQKEEG